MAVVQISRIQVRRGQKNQGSGLPQLASGELGWAIDSQELFIGNGSVSEGAPAVGNTKILTQHDNIFEFANTYIYKPGSIVQTGPSTTTPIARNLQDRLDDVVSIRSFGCPGDGTECSTAFQRAIDQLYLNSNKTNAQSRVILYVEPGTYLFNKPVYVPPFATIIGAGPEKTIISQTAAQDKVTLGPIFRTVHGDSTIGNPGNDSQTTFANQARYITIEGMTLRVVDDYRALRLESTRNSIFKNLRIVGDWNVGDTINGSNIAIQLNSFSTVVTCKDNVFEEVDINGFSYAVESRYDIRDNIFEKFNIDNVHYGIVFGYNTTLGVVGQTTGPINNYIKDSIFGHGDFGIEKQAIWVEIGTGNESNNNKFYNVGNGPGGYASPLTSIIKFSFQGNRSESDYFERSKYLTSNQDLITGTPFVPNIEGTLFFESGSQQVTVGQYTSPTRIFRLPASSSVVYDVEYWYQSTHVIASRQGTLTIFVDYSNNDVSIVDDFEYLGDAGFAENISFTAALTDEDNDSDKDTLVISMKNTTTLDTGNIIFKATTKSRL